MLLGLFFKTDIKKTDDAGLLVLVRQNNPRALGELFERYSFLVTGLCLKYLKDQMAAEDMMMKVFESLPEKIQRNEISNFKSWLYSVAKNECLMVLRKKKVTFNDADKALLYEADESEDTLKLALLKEEQLKKLETAIEELKNEHKQCLLHFYIERKSYEEIASLTGYDMNQVKSYIQNGKRNLKLILEKHSEFRP
jgi:RNA polymerase sigma factor (sigma-70 family)